MARPGPEMGCRGGWGGPGATQPTATASPDFVGLTGWPHVTKHEPLDLRGQLSLDGQPPTLEATTPRLPLAHTVALEKCVGLKLNSA